MTQKEKIEQLESAILAAEKKITANSRAIVNMKDGRVALVKEWKVYENKYRNYLAKRDRFQNFLWWLWRKITLRSTRITRKILNERVAKKMARIFYKGSRK